MGRRRRGQAVHGVVLLNKPAGPSSNQVLQQVRRLFEAAKAGHTGNLDPFATGMLPICFGEASKTAAFMLDADKAYRATAILGQRSSTGDTEGEIIETGIVPDLSNEDIETVMQGFLGESEQIPPMYSALKHKGQPLYKLAREGKTVERKARSIHIHSLTLDDWNSPELTFTVSCGKGTYVRTLAEDLATRLGTVAHLAKLHRLHVAPFERDPMVSLDSLQAAAEQGTLKSFLLPADHGLLHWPVLELGSSDAARFSNGNFVSMSELMAGQFRVYSESGLLLGLGEVDSDGLLKPMRVFNIAE